MMRPGAVRRHDHFRLLAVGVLAAAMFTLACGDSAGPSAPAGAASASSASGTTVGTVFEEPAIDIEKATNGVDSDQAPGEELTVGDPVTWTYVVTNTGSWFLRRVKVTDDILGDITCNKTELAVGASMTCTATGFAAEGQYKNVGTVEAWAMELPWTDSDPSHYVGILEGPGDWGCSQGYWGNHLASWQPTGISPWQRVDSVFASAGLYPEIGMSTLQEALAFGGGKGSEGAARNLLRQAVASLLNAVHPDVAFPMSASEVVAAVDAALASDHRKTMNSLKDDLDFDNNLGCPLD